MKLVQVRANVLKVKLNYNSGSCCDVSMHLCIRLVNLEKKKDLTVVNHLQCKGYRRDREFINAKACFDKQVTQAPRG